MVKAGIEEASCRFSHPPAIAVVSVTRRKYGGNVYEEMLADVLSGFFRVEEINAGVRIESKLKYLEAPLVLWRLYKISRKNDFTVIIRGFDAALFLNPKPAKNIVIMHHFDNSARSCFLKPIFSFLGHMACSNLKKAEKIVVVSEFWKNYLKARGFKNISVIHNAFDLEKFNFPREEVELFKEKYCLTHKPIVYIGNCRKDKGVIDAYNALKLLNVHLVTSGRLQVNLPVMNLELNYRNYLNLLKASSAVVALSKFQEGWNRTAHEAMLCGTPVVGFDKGGMKELLESGGQVTCRNSSQIKEKVLYCLEHPEIGEKGREFAKNYSQDKFAREWLELVRSLA